MMVTLQVCSPPAVARSRGVDSGIGDCWSPIPLSTPNGLRTAYGSEESRKEHPNSY